METTSVMVDVVVADNKGHPTASLTAKDFAVYDNSIAQKIVTFVPPLATNADRTPTPGPSSAGFSTGLDARRCATKLRVSPVLLVFLN